MLKQALVDPAFERVTVLSRRPVGVTHAKLSEVIVRDFLDYSAIRLDHADACIWCLGVSQSRVSRIERGDMDRTEIATVRAYVGALGGEVEIVAKFGDERFTIG